MTLKQHHAALAASLRKTTLAILKDQDHVYLARKKRGLGIGRWNFAGGKVRKNQTPQANACLETWQEFGVKIKQPRLAAILYFYFRDVPADKGWNQKCYVYVTEDWRGEPRESAEMAAPQRWQRGTFPYAEMWPGDRDWIEPVLDGQILTGYFLSTGEPPSVELEIVLGQIIDE